METPQIFISICSLVTSIAAVCTIVYGFGKFLAKPYDTLEQRVTVLEVKQQEMEREKNKLDVRCKEQDETNEVLIRSTLALIEYEIQSCLTENKPMSDDLKQAKKDLQNYLAKK